MYDALVRMAQPFAMRAPLVDGSGNFGSLDGDPAAAMRYTECRLAPVATRLLDELDQDTVPFRPNYDGTKSEPVVLPARLPNLLVNGTTGIAVGMATNIPPHNPEEVCRGVDPLARRVARGQAALVARPVSHRQRPGLPHRRANRLEPPRRSRQVYETGQGTFKVRATLEAARDPSRENARSFTSPASRTR
ncbi:MAG: DNA gyrase subunit A [Polyangiaceae bacterium]